nr:retrotransposon protein, putative, Ty1-copia subclass [Tanacetum cinerariifolium]
MALQCGRVQKYKQQGKAKGKGKCKGPQNSYPTKPKKPHLTRKSIRQKMDNVTTAIEFEKSIKRNNHPIVGASSTLQVMAIQCGRVQKYKQQGKAKGKGKCKGPQNSYPTKPKKPHLTRKSVRQKMDNVTTAKMKDIGKGTGLRGAKKLKRGSLYLYVGNVVRTKVEAIGSFDLVLPNGLIIVLDNYHYAPSITRGVVSVSRLIDKGFTQCFTDFRLSVSMNNMLYFNAITVNGYPKETMSYYFYYPPEKKIVVERCADFLEKDFILQKESGRIVQLEDEDILPSENTSEHHIEEEKIDPDRLCFNVEVKEHSLGDLNEPSNYKETLSDPEFEKWLAAMNAKMQSMILIAITSYYDYEICQMDVKTAFLNDFLEEEIYMEQHEGFIDHNHPRMDNSKRDSIPMQVDLHLSKSQCATTSAKMKHMHNVPYASAVGSIMYAVRCTRPDVAFAQNITCRFQQNSGEAHWTVVKNILKYLRNTKDTFLVYGGDPEAELRANCYCDAGFETDRDDTRSQTGYVFVLNGGAVVCKSSKQSTTAQHATEAEYIVASEAAKEAIWIRKFIDERD